MLTAGFGFDLGYMIVAWSAWVPNLLVVEWFLSRRQWVVQRRQSISSV
jgi:hypothetical protein